MTRCSKSCECCERLVKLEEEFDEEGFKHQRAIESLAFDHAKAKASLEELERKAGTLTKYLKNEVVLREGQKTDFDSGRYHMAKNALSILEN